MRISDWSSDVCSSDLVCDRIAALLNDPQAVHGLVPDASAETLSRLLAEAERQHILLTTGSAHDRIQLLSATVDRSEERRVGKECVSTCRSRWSSYHYKKKNKYTDHI